jgi:hypothetical protein
VYEREEADDVKVKVSGYPWGTQALFETGGFEK